MTMKRLRFSVALASAIALASPAVAGDHRLPHSIARFVEAWNAHDAIAMAKRWTADASANDALGRAATGRVGVARLFGEGDSTLKLTSDIVVRQRGEGIGVDERDLGFSGVVEFEGEISGMRTSNGATLPPFVRRFTAQLVWRPDLPGGHHPGGRYFIASMRLEAPPR